MIPRSKSTVILKILSNNAEVKAIFEPFAFAYFSKHYENKFTFEDLREAIAKEPFTDDNIILKDAPDFVENLDFGSWVTDKTFKHILLIRNPVDVAMSTVGVKGQSVRFINWPSYFPDHPTIEGTFQVMIKLRDYLQRNGFDYKVFDSEGLNPEDGLDFIRSICEFGDLPFDEGMIYTKSSDSFPESWWRPPTAHLLSDSAALGLDFHGNACKSTSLEPSRTVAHDLQKDLTEAEKEKMEYIKTNVVPLYMKLKNGLHWRNLKGFMKQCATILHIAKYEFK